MPHPCILSADDIHDLPARDKTHFLNPQGRRQNTSLGDATGLANIGVHHVVIAPGFESTEAHIHHIEEEAVYVLDGKGAVELDGERFPIGAGDFIGLPAGGPSHVFVNNSDAPLTLLVVGERREFDVADYPRQGKRLYRYGDEWDLVELDAVTDPKASRADIGAK